MIKEFLPQKVFGLPKGSRTGQKTSKKVRNHIYFVTVGRGEYLYKRFKVHLKRQNKSKIKYFKTRKAAEIFLESLRLNPYL